MSIMNFLVIIPQKLFIHHLKRFLTQNSSKDYPFGNKGRDPTYGIQSNTQLILTYIQQKNTFSQARIMCFFFPLNYTFSLSSIMIV